MKTNKIRSTLIAIVALLGFSANVQTQAAPSPKTDTVKVMGNCGMCKSRIEKATKTDGVSQAQWDSKTKLLTLVYDPAQTSLDAISQKVAAEGHDTDKRKADDKVYAKLPGCCQYDRSK